MAEGRNHFEKILFVWDRLRDLGLEPRPDTRLWQERESFINPTGTPRTVHIGDPMLGTSFEAVRDYTLYEVLLDPWPFGTEELPLAKLAESLEDDADVDAELNTPGRDTQNELFIAVQMHRANQRPRFLETTNSKRPDLRGHIAGQYVYVEAKRVKSERAVMRRVLQGIEQLRTTFSPGIIYVDVSRAFTAPRHEQGMLRDFGTSDVDYERNHKAWLRSRISRYESDLLGALEGTCVVGVFFQDHQLRKLSEMSVGIESCAITFDNLANAKDPHRAWKRFCETINRAWGN